MFRLAVQRSATTTAARARSAASGGARHVFASQAAPAPLTYYSAWFCPFAHRATLALEHHAEAVPYQWEEALGWEQRPPTGQENFEASERTDWWYHWKSPGLLAANPLGMVPTLVEPSLGGSSLTPGRAVIESLVCVEFVDELAVSRGSAAAPLLPADPWARAAARVAADQVHKTVCSEYYKVLVRSDPTERLDAFARLLDGLRAFAKQGRANNAQAQPGLEAGQVRGGFWGGGASLGLVDCALLPYAYRLYVLEHYRGAAFAVPTPPPRAAASSGGHHGGGGQRRGEADGAAADEEAALWGWYHAWLAQCVAAPSVRRTLPDQARYLEHVKKYAEGKARSKVGNAVRRGADAHAYDDKLDGDT